MESLNEAKDPTTQQLLVEKAGRSPNPFESIANDYLNFEKEELCVRLYCKRKADLDSKMIKWAFKLAERNVSGHYKKCSLGWQPKIKQTDLNKNWARYLIAENAKTKTPVAYTMFRFDLDYGFCVLYCYEMQVDESSQRKGLGGFMMKALEEIAKYWGMEKIVLTILNNNDDASKFYQRLGYTVDVSSPDIEDNNAYKILSKSFI